MARGLGHCQDEETSDQDSHGSGRGCLDPRDGQKTVEHLFPTAGRLPLNASHDLIGQAVEKARGRDLMTLEGEQSTELIEFFRAILHSVILDIPITRPAIVGVRRTNATVPCLHCNP